MDDIRAEQPLQHCQQSLDMPLLERLNLNETNFKYVRLFQDGTSIALPVTLQKQIAKNDFTDKQKTRTKITSYAFYY